MKTKNILLITTLAVVPLFLLQQGHGIPPRSVVRALEQTEEAATAEEAPQEGTAAEEAGQRAAVGGATVGAQNSLEARSGQKTKAAEARAEYRVAQGTASENNGLSSATTLSSDGLFGNRWHTLVRGGSPSRALIIRSSETEPKEHGALEKDLTIMSHILDKALTENVGRQGQEQKAMGINVYFSPGSSPMRSMFLEGYGALFLLNVGFPVMPAPTREETPKEEASTDSSWQEAERELYGRGDEGKLLGGTTEPYDEEKVSKLKDALLEALKNASNIRSLKADDSITVCVFGSAAGSTRKSRTTASHNTTIATTRSGDEPHVWVTNAGAPQRGSVLTIRVKKADADAFAKGKLELEDFRKKAKMVAYPGDLASDGPLIFGTGNSGAYGYGYSR